MRTWLQPDSNVPSACTATGSAVSWDLTGICTCTDTSCPGTRSSTVGCTASTAEHQPSCADTCDASTARTDGALATTRESTSSVSWHPLEDVYCTGEEGYARWREFIKIDANWQPETYDTSLKARRRFHARVAYEYTLLMKLCEDGEREWLCIDVIRHFRLLAMLELRMCEIQLASHQLGSNVLGILTTDKERLFAGAMLAFRAQLELFDLVCKAGNIKKGRKEVLAERPSRTDGTTQWAKALDRQLHAITCYCHEGGAERVLKAVPNRVSPGELQGLVTKLWLVVTCLDRLLVEV